ncbi:MAG: helix-turn-helix domain-containing protein [Lachnospiraceae bacterium]|nr:helix-turn-helix domain-containing protein [Lachnospiraceae bacterium]
MAGEISRETAQQIVDTVKDVCGQNINFIDDHGTIIASTDDVRVGTFHEIGKEVILTGMTMEVVEDEEYEGAKKGVNFPIFHGDRAIAAIGISGEPESVRKYAYLVQRISSLLLKEREFDVQERKRSSRLNYYVRALIHGEKLPAGHMEEFLKEYHYADTERFCTVIVRIVSEENPDNLFMLERRIYQAFEACGFGLYTFEYPNQYIVLLREKTYKKRWTLLHELAEEYGKFLRISAGSMERLKEQVKSFRTAELVMQGLHAEKTIAAYEDLDIELLLGSVPEQVRENYIKKTLEHLEKEDRHVLTVYFEENLSLIRAGERLNLHKNTLQYRLDRIYKRCGYNPRAFQDAVVLYTALRL